MSSYPNLIVIRTFSKALALSSLRLGYVIASPDFILELQKIRGPYDVNVVAVLAAREQLNNPEHWQKMVRHLMDESKPTIEKYFDERKIIPDETRSVNQGAIKPWETKVFGYQKKMFIETITEILNPVSYTHLTLPTI